MALYFIHSRRWRENHDAAIKAFLGRAGTTLEAFLPDLESHELMFSLGKHFEDGPLIPALVADAYRYFARLARDFGKPAHTADGFLATFLAADIEDLKKECRKRAPADLEAVIANATP